MNWLVERFPACTHHAFIAHVAEDLDNFARPLRNELVENCGIAAWIDAVDFPVSSNDDFRVLRDAILTSRFVVYLVTQESLTQGRGWHAIERCYGELLQRSIELEYPLQLVELPLFFVAGYSDKLTRSCWRQLAASSSAKFYPRHAEPETGAMIRWAAGQIAAFVGKQQKAGDALAAMLSIPKLRNFIDSRPGLDDRLACRFPEV